MSNYNPLLGEEPLTHAGMQINDEAIESIIAAVGGAWHPGRTYTINGDKDNSLVQTNAKVPAWLKQWCEKFIGRDKMYGIPSLSSFIKDAMVNQAIALTALQGSSQQVAEMRLRWKRLESEREIQVQIEADNHIRAVSEQYHSARTTEGRHRIGAQIRAELEDETDSERRASLLRILDEDLKHP